MSVPGALARYSDGHSAAQHNVQTGIDGTDLCIASPDGTVLDRWPLDAVRLIGGPERDGTVRLCRFGADARLTLLDPGFYAHLQTQCPRLHAGSYAQGVPWHRVAIWVVAAVASVAIFFFVLVPTFARQAVALIPARLEERAGINVAELLIPQLAHNPRPICSGSAGAVALAKLVASLTAAAGLPYAPHVRVVNAPIVNAFALPGGQILVLRGLLDFAEHPNEVAGVIAHELGHVERRHPLQIAIERSSGAIVIGFLMGDAVGFSATALMASTLLSSHYSREMEAEADERGLAFMRGAGFDSSPLAQFFARLEKHEDGASQSLLSTHPPTEARMVRAGRETGGGAALDGRDWASLKAICR